MQADYPWVQFGENADATNDCLQHNATKQGERWPDQPTANLAANLNRNNDAKNCNQGQREGQQAIAELDRAVPTLSRHGHIRGTGAFWPGRAAKPAVRQAHQTAGHYDQNFAYQRSQTGESQQSK